MNLRFVRIAVLSVASASLAGMAEAGRGGHSHRGSWSCSRGHSGHFHGGWGSGCRIGHGRGYYYGSAIGFGIGLLSAPLYYRAWTPPPPAYYHYGPRYYDYGYTGPVYRAGAAGLAYEVQSALAEMGYNPGPIDGIVGRGTRAALRAFQADQRLPVSGRIDRPTLDALGIG